MASDNYQADPLAQGGLGQFLLSARSTEIGVHLKVRSWLRRSPRIYLPLVQFKHRPFDGSRKTLDHATELVIDAFPRSGNTFAVHAFLAAQHRPVKLAHHFHAPAAIIAAARLHIPVLTIVRQPKDAIISFLIYAASDRLMRAIDEYIEFYRAVAARRDRVFVARFDSITSDFGQVLAAFNERYGTSFALFVHTKENVKKVFDTIEHLPVSKAKRSKWSAPIEGWKRRPSPDKKREMLKDRLQLRFTEPAPKGRLEEAESLFASLDGIADA